MGVYKDERDPSAQFKGPRKSCNLGIYRHPAETLGTEDEIQGAKSTQQRKLMTKNTHIGRYA